MPAEKKLKFFNEGFQKSLIAGVGGQSGPDVQPLKGSGKRL
jgi:hypothetical protein